MATIKKFEELECWKKARKLNNRFFTFVKQRRFNDDRDLERQMKRSSGSIMDNIAEGFDRGSNKEFIQFLYISKASNTEFRSQLYRALDWRFLQDEEMKGLYEESIETARMTQGLIDYLRKSDIKGKKFRD